MCRSSCLYNLVLCNLRRHGRGTSRGKQGVNLCVSRTFPISWERRNVSLCDSVKADWTVLSSSVPSEIAVQDEVFKLPAWLWLVIIFLWSVVYLLPFTVVQALLWASVCECKDITQLLCTQAIMANLVYLLQVVLTSCVAVAAPCGAGRSFGVNPTNQFTREQGKHFVYINTVIRFLSVSVPCKGRDNDGIPPCECMVAQALRKKPTMVVTSAAPDRDRTCTPDLIFRTRFNRKK